MRYQRIFSLTVVLAIAVAVTTKAQSIRDPRIIADIPYEVVVGERHLQPGEYEIRGLGSNNPVIQLISQDSLKVEAITMPIFAEAKSVPETTQITLQKVEGNYYLDKIWIQGKLTGFEVPLPASVKALQIAEARRIAYEGTNEPPPVTASAEPAVAPNVEVARAQTQEERASVEPVVAQPRQGVGVLAQVSPPSQPSVVRTVATPETPSQTVTRNVAQAPEPTRELPATAANWLELVLAGIGALGAGAALRFRR